MRLTTRIRRTARTARKFLWAVANPDHPLLVHLIPMRRCNLSCSYCNEYDTTSKPVPTDVMLRRIDRLAELHTTVLTISGGEPLMHPELEALVAHARRRDLFVTLITNGYHLSRERIQRLNQSGLDHLQISIDNVEPDDTSMKSLRLLEPKLRWLAEGADFTVAVNSVVGGGIRTPADALTIATRAKQLGLMTSLGIIHDGHGQLKPLGPHEMRIYREFKKLGRQVSVLRFNRTFQDNLALGRPNDWSCRAGARYLYVDEDGIVSYCSQQRGLPGIPLERYGVEDIRREFATKKDCAPYCTVNCVQQTAVFDKWRRAPQIAQTRKPVKGTAPAPEPPPSRDQVLAG